MSTRFSHVCLTLCLALMILITGIARGQATFNVIHNFSTLGGTGTNADGAGPDCGLVTGTDGFYYGVTSTGGTHETGAIFKVSPDGKTFTTLHSFDAVDGNGINVQGADPEAPLVAGTDGFLYGTNFEGGPEYTRDGVQGIERREDVSGDPLVQRCDGDGYEFSIEHGRGESAGGTDFRPRWILVRDNAVWGCGRDGRRV